MSPYLQSNSWATSISSNGNFAYFVEAEDYRRMLEKPNVYPKNLRRLQRKR